MSGSGGFNSGGFARPQQRQPMRQQARPQATPKVSQPPMPPMQQAAPIPQQLPQQAVQQPPMQSPGIPTGTGGMNAQDFYNKYNYQKQPQYQSYPQMGWMPKFNPYGGMPQDVPFGEGGMMQGMPYGKGGMGGGMFGGMGGNPYGGMPQQFDQSFGVTNQAPNGQSWQDFYGKQNIQNLQGMFGNMFGGMNQPQVQKPMGGGGNAWEQPGFNPNMSAVGFPQTYGGGMWDGVKSGLANGTINPKLAAMM